ncbi:coatomer epsilon subunit-domain-containing protein [Epithele typhae]|uniref:coatomer epsilon subunit-domain-containing protein n=1 Tax=Epithele typhae TaxID=378194 RepID=UPI002007EC3C|nr:coatomer epsilon subunit-domain-containing protein [Epithele typhae]KAH9940834.1 coatomer epsilon subunit-domain-containing protein [Epithele typhae]
MDSSELYHVKQQFTLGAYKSLVDLTLPDALSPEYNPTLVYQARAHIALGNTAAAEALIPADTENVALKSVAALARFVTADEDAREPILEEFRDLSVEIEGECDASAWEKGVVRVLAGTAFVRVGEIEEALETLGAGNDTQNLEAVAYTVQVYLSIHRPDLARKEFDRAKRWAEDDLLLQLIEASIGLGSGKDAYSDAHAFYTEQLANPSLSSPHLLTARGVARLLRGEVPAATSDLEEAQSQMGGAPDAETLAAQVIAAGLAAPKAAEADELFSKLAAEHPGHPLVTDYHQKASLFDELASKFTVPPLAAASA